MPSSTERPAAVDRLSTARADVFQVPPLAHIAATLILISIIYPISISLWFLPLLLLPLTFAWWVARAKTVVNPERVVLYRAIGTTSIPWSKIKGVLFPRRGFAVLVTTDEKQHRMRGVSFADLPRLAVASENRIPDPAQYK